MTTDQLHRVFCDTERLSEFFIVPEALDLDRVVGAVCYLPGINIRQQLSDALPRTISAILNNVNLLIPVMLFVEWNSKVTIVEKINFSALE